LFYSSQFSRDDQRVMTPWKQDNASGIWRVPTITGTNEDILLLADLAEATCGSALQTSGQTEILNPLSGDKINATRRTISDRFSTSSKSLTLLQRFLKWAVSDPRTRTISPFSELTVPEWVVTMIKEGTVDSLRAAMHVDPSNARLVANYARRLADYAMAEGTDPDEGGRARVKADFQTRRAFKLAPENDEVKKLRAEVAELLQLPLDPSGGTERVLPDPVPRAPGPKPPHEVAVKRKAIASAWLLVLTFGLVAFVGIGYLVFWSQQWSQQSNEIARLSVQTEPPGASIFLDGKPPQTPPNTFTHVPFGTYQLTATLEDFEPIKQAIQVRRGMTLQIRLQLKPSHGPAPSP
jgi:hypothetical protein